jgi:hypothetical protein
MGNLLIIVGGLMVFVGLIGLGVKKGIESTKD